jgi:surfactin synthase thioesterase subunit
MVETYTELPGPRLPCSITALGGDADPVVRTTDIAAWRAATSGPFEWLILEGGHFYVNTARQRVIEAVRRRLPE